MGTVAGPFDRDDWYTMGQLKLDLAFSEKLKKSDPDLYEEAATDIRRKFKGYISREAA